MALNLVFKLPLCLACRKTCADEVAASLRCTGKVPKAEADFGAWPTYSKQVC